VPLRSPSTPPGLETLTLAEAAVLLSSGRGAAGHRLQRVVEAQLVRRAVLGADRDDVRADVAFALLVSARGDRLTLDAACAHVARVARNKAVDHHRRRRHESPAELAIDQLAIPVAGTLGRDLDIVSGEVHRRNVARDLAELVGDLPASERLALDATATGSGSRGSGLGRSSHYRALDRARLRLTSAVRSRIAGGLALPLLLLRNAGVVRDVLAPLGAVAIAGAASLALVLPAVDLPAAPVAHVVAPTQLTHVTVTVAVAIARPPRVAPVRVSHRRLAPAKPAVVRHALPQHTSLPAPTAHRSVRRPAARPSSTPDAGLGPCRAALLCQ
jgi:DNA-directed RNA polymerase specialized sigma24 family protein